MAKQLQNLINKFTDYIFNSGDTEKGHNSDGIYGKINRATEKELTPINNIITINTNSEGSSNIRRRGRIATNKDAGVTASHQSEQQRLRLPYVRKYSQSFDPVSHCEDPNRGADMHLPVDDTRYEQTGSKPKKFRSEKKKWGKSANVSHAALPSNMKKVQNKKDKTGSERQESDDEALGIRDDADTDYNELPMSRPIAGTQDLSQSMDFLTAEVRSLKSDVRNLSTRLSGEDTLKAKLRKCASCEALEEASRAAQVQNTAQGNVYNVYNYSGSRPAQTPWLPF